MRMRDQLIKTTATLTDLYDARGEKHSPQSDMYQIVSDKMNVVDEDPDMFEAMRLATQYSHIGRKFHVFYHDKLTASYLNGEHSYDATII